jgi:hypothetical protein
MTFTRFALRSTLVACLALVGACESTEPEVFTEPNVPAEFNGRPVDVQGTAYVASPNVVLNLWDSGAIDGDIVSIMVNGVWVVQNLTLTGTKQPFNVTLNPSGYSYIMLYAHNEGDISPNTAAVSLNDGTGEQTLVLSADLLTNGAYNIVVEP